MRRNNLDAVAAQLLIRVGRYQSAIADEVLWLGLDHIEVETVYGFGGGCRAKVTRAIVRLEQGNFSSVKSVSEGVFEYRIDFGPSLATGCISTERPGAGDPSKGGTKCEVAWNKGSASYVECGMARGKGFSC